MKRALLIFPMILLVAAAAALATRWYEVEEGTGRPEQKTEQKIEPKDAGTPSETPPVKEPSAPAENKDKKPVATWMYTYGGSGEDNCRALAKAENGYVMAGLTKSFGAGGGDAWFIRTDADGKAVWDKTYGVSAEEDALGIAASDTGGWCVAGKDLTNKFLALKIGDDGKVEWHRNFGGAQPAYGLGVAASPGGGCLVSGYFTRNPGNPCNGYSWISSLDREGETDWEWNDAPACNSWTRAVTTTQFGTYIAAGEKSEGKETSSYWILKLDENRLIRWEVARVAGGYRIFLVKSVMAAGDGGFVVAGGARINSKHSQYDGWMIKVDAAGNTVWEKHYNKSDDPNVLNSVIEIEGGILVAAGYKMLPDGRYKGSLMETDSYGTAKWHKTFGGAGSESFSGVVKAVEGDGYVVAGITSSRGAGNYDFLVMKTDRRGVCMGCKF